MVQEKLCTISCQYPPRRFNDTLNIDIQFARVYGGNYFNPDYDGQKKISA